MYIFVFSVLTILNIKILKILLNFRKVFIKNVFKYIVKYIVVNK